MKKRERRWTVLVVPSRGEGEVRQRDVTSSDLRNAAVAGAGVVAALVAVAVVPWVDRPTAPDTQLAEENATLREQLADVEARVAAIQPMVDCVRAFDEQLRELDKKSAIPGTGDYDADEWQARQDWINGVVGQPEEEASTLAEHLDIVEDQLGGLDLSGLQSRITAVSDTVHEQLPQLWPVEGVLTSRFGYRHSPYGNGEWRFHKGIDIGVPFGTPILATGDGVVVFSGWDAGHGQMVVVDHGDGIATRYCHASALLVEAGDEVYAGDTLALVGSTGISTGPHLHYEIWFDGEPADPLWYLPGR